ncbi:MAG: tRNA pseudouridine(13) synthase TruD [Nanoarchaeota archaeon]|nr:tRNA pseudouridine(13) synthase TruD [Nanoarchaeota archaeon]
MYTIKQLPEDFIVQEKSTIVPRENGPYLYVLLRKRERTIFDVLQELSRKLRIREKDIGFAGSKDKQAVTEQVISLYRKRKEDVLGLQLRGATLSFLGYGTTPISLGDLEGNQFIIVVRNLDEESIKKEHTGEIRFFPNYFDEQRFSLHNAEIGKWFVKKHFKEAAALIQEPRFQEQLQKEPNNPIGALQRLPLRLLRMYMSAYQSYLWNETLAAYVREKGKILKEVPYSLGTFVFIDDEERFPQLQIPLVGFGSEELEKEPAVKAIITALLEKEGINHNDFIIKQIPDITPEGELRKAFVEIKDFSRGTIESDELNPGKKKVTVRFFLSKGSYATMVIRKMLA